MVFLNPSVLFGLFAASIPLIIHLLNLRKLQKVDFSTLAFLKELQKSKIKKVKIKQWILLLLRTLIIIFLVLTFARPTLESNSFISGNSTAKTSVIFILDNSFSMSYVGGEGSNFNKSKKMIKEALSELKDGDEFILLLNSDSSFSTSSIEAFQKQIDNFKISEFSESNLTKLSKAISILASTKNINKEIFLFSDFQASTLKYESNIDSINHIARENGIKLYSFNISEPSANNYSVSDLKLDNSILELNKPVTFTATFNNYSNLKDERLVASLFLNDSRVAQKSLHFNKNILVEKFSTTITKSGLNKARIELEEDNIINDNQNYLNFFVPHKINILILYEQNEDISFLETALNSTSASNQIIIEKHFVGTLTSLNYNNYDVIFLVSDYSDGNLKSHLIEGGKLVFIPPSNLNTNELLSLSSEIGLPHFQNIIETNIEKNNYNEIKTINWEHPIFENLFEIQINMKFESPILFKYINFKSSSKYNNILSLLDDSSFLSEYDFGKGKVLFFNTSTNLSWSNFPIKGIFAPLISRCVYYLASINSHTNSYFTGDAIPINTSHLTLPIIDVELPIGKDKINFTNNSTNIVNYKNTSFPGNYEFKNDDNLLTYASVNVNPKESDLALISSDSLEIIYNKLFGDNYFMFNKSQNYLEKIQRTRYGTELWKHMLIFAFLFALVEMFVARSRKKDLVHTKG